MEVLRKEWERGRMGERKVIIFFSGILPSSFYDIPN
jgi:hypothetical protein